MKKLVCWVFLAALFALSNSAQSQGYQFLGFCDGCTRSAQWEQAAEDASFRFFPGFIGTHEIYVLDPTGAKVRAFSVTRWFEDTGIIPQSSEEKRSSRASLSGYFHADARPIPNDPEVESSILNALAAVREIADTFKYGQVSIEDLGLFAQIPSAIDLVGPIDSSAGYNRNALRNELNSYVNGVINDAVIQLYDLAQQFLTTLLSDSSIQWFSGFVVTFPDGTIIDVQLNRLGHIPGAGDNRWTIDVTVLEHTARGGGLSAVPTHPGHFSNFMYQGDINIIAAIMRLAQRYGIPVNGEGGSGSSSRFVCQIDGDFIHCRKSNSGY